MSQIDFKRVIGLLKDFTQGKKASLELILIGGLALHFYGKKDRATADVDAEVKGDLEALFLFLKEHHIPSDLSEDFSGWSVIAMPPGYQGRARTVYEDPLLKIKILSPPDFIVAKLRRFTEEDIEDALFVAGKKLTMPLLEIPKIASSDEYNINRWMTSETCHFYVAQRRIYCSLVEVLDLWTAPLQLDRI